MRHGEGLKSTRIAEDHRLHAVRAHLLELAGDPAAARDAYLPHPEHEKFGALLGDLGIFEDAFVVDYAPAE